MARWSSCHLDGAFATNDKTSFRERATGMSTCGTGSRFSPGVSLLRGSGCSCSSPSKVLATPSEKKGSVVPAGELVRSCTAGKYLGANSGELSAVFPDQGHGGDPRVRCTIGHVFSQTRVP